MNALRAGTPGQLLLAALRAVRRYSGPLIEGLRHHFAEEAEEIWVPALAAGLTVTPEGEPGHLVALYEQLAARAPGLRQ